MRNHDTILSFALAMTQGKGLEKREDVDSFPCFELLEELKNYNTMKNKFKTGLMAEIVEGVFIPKEDGFIMYEAWLNITTNIRFKIPLEDYLSLSTFTNPMEANLLSKWLIG